MTKPLAVILLFLVLNGCEDHKEFILDADPGAYNAHELNNLSDTHLLKASLSISEFKKDKDWPSAAYIGFHEDDNRDNSIQFLIIRNKESDAFIVAGYRLIENGKEVEVKPLKHIKLYDKVDIELNFNKGEVDILLDNKNFIKIKTKLNLVKAYISASSCTAKITIKGSSRHFDQIKL